MRVTLVFPPNRGVPASPYGALPLLAGCLRAAGHQVSFVDANLEVFDRLVRRDTVEAFRGEFEAHWNELRSAPRLDLGQAHVLQTMARLGTVPFERLLEAEDAAAGLRDPQPFSDPDFVRRAYDTLAFTLRALYAAHPFYNRYRQGSNDELFRYVEAHASTPVGRILDEVVLDRVLETRPDLVALTIPFNEQTVEALDLLARLRRRAPGVRSVVGGAAVSAWERFLAVDERFYSVVDFAMPGEAEDSLPALCAALETGGPLEGELAAVPNLWFRAGGTVHEPTRRATADLDAAPTPDFDGLPLERYLLPKLVVNYQTSRGCYYQKCTFCSDDIKGNFRFRRPELVIADLERIQQQTGSRHFVFWDPLTSPRMMKRIAHWNRGRPADERIHWGAETKFEKVFTQPEFCTLLAEGGASFLQFGFESGSQRVLDLMVKGNDLERTSLMLEQLERAGVAVSVQWFIGFPGATEAEDEASYRYLDAHRSAVTLSSYMGEFQTAPGHDAFDHGGELYDIELVFADEGRWDYRYRDGRPHYDREELHAAYLARGDAETVDRMAFFLYLTDQPRDVRRLSRWEQGGALPRTWSDIADAVPRFPDSNHRARWDFDALTHPSAQGLPARGTFPSQACELVTVGISQRLYALSDLDVALLDAVDGQRTAAEVALVAESSTLATQAECRARLLRACRRGVLQVPVAVPSKADQRPARDDRTRAGL